MKLMHLTLTLTHPIPISFSETVGPVFFSDAHGPIAPAILNSLEWRTSIWPPKPICNWDAPVCDVYVRWWERTVQSCDINFASKRENLERFSMMHRKMLMAFKGMTLSNIKVQIPLGTNDEIL